MPPNWRWLSISGQVGVAPDGIAAQTELCWANNLRILEANGMGVENIVKEVQYLTGSRTATPISRCATATSAMTS